MKRIISKKPYWKFKTHSLAENERRKRPNMAKVLVSMKIFPTDITVDLNQLKQKIEKGMPKNSSVYKFAEEPIAFGLNALIVHILIPEEKSGELEKVETNLKNIEGISSVETFMVQRW